MASKTQKILLSGMVKWVRYREVDKFGKYSCTLYLDPPSLTKFKEIKEGKNLRNELKKDDDGHFVRLSSVPDRIIQGKKVIFRVEAVGPDNSPLDEDVGNGSEATVKIDLYPFNYGGKEGWAIRWTGIKVTNLVRYKGASEWTQDEAKARKGLEDVNDPVWD